MSPADLGSVIDLGAEPMPSARAVAFLRDRHERGMTVAWCGRLTGALDVASLHHLPPPETLEGGEPECAAWRDSHARAFCHFRRGPGFALVMDGRDPGFTAKYTLDRPDLLDAFITCLRPTPLERLRPAEREAALTLHKERLLLVVGGVAVTLATRTREWRAVRRAG